MEAGDRRRREGRQRLLCAFNADETAQALFLELEGRPAPVLGRVCMDQMVVDVTDIPEVRMGDEAVLLGGKGGDSFFDAAQKIGTISYELVCSVARRVPRVYMQGGEAVSATDYLEGE